MPNSVSAISVYNRVCITVLRYGYYYFTNSHLLNVFVVSAHVKWRLWRLFFMYMHMRTNKTKRLLACAPNVAEGIATSACGMWVQSGRPFLAFPVMHQCGTTVFCHHLVNVTTRTNDFVCMCAQLISVFHYLCMVHVHVEYQHACTINAYLSCCHQLLMHSQKQKLLLHRERKAVFCEVEQLWQEKEAWSWLQGITVVCCR